MRAYTAAEVRAAEAPLLEAGVPLMARAADGLAGVLRTTLDERPGPVLVLAGSGNNGGDALFAVAPLAAEGTSVTILVLGSRVHEDGLAAALAAGAVRADPDDAIALATGSAVVVDAILGTGAGLGAGASPALRGLAREVVAAIRPIAEAPSGPLVVAVDLPSGIDPDDGRVPDPTVLRAHTTVTFGAMKRGLLLAPASTYAGEVRLIDIGLPLPA